MRKLLFFFLLFLLCVYFASIGSAAAAGTERIILYTYYRQMGWGDRVQIGSVDEKGTVRTLTGHDSSLNWPYKPEEQLAYLSQTERFTEAGTLPPGEIFRVKTLIYETEDQGSRSVHAANDAGTEKSYAVNYTREGEPVFLLLGMSGDEFFENTDPDARALYLLLRRLFSGVTSYAYGMPGIGPRGFEPVSFAEFTGLDPETAAEAEIRSFMTDCEEGNIPREMTEEERAALLSLIRGGRVTGKADNVESTGGVTVYVFYGPDGNVTGSLSFEDGLLVSFDGRYYFTVS